MSMTTMTTSTNNLPPPQWAQATQAVQEANTILIVTHVGPDGDAIGSAMGLAHVLTALGKQVTVADDDGVPDYLAFIPGSEHVVQWLDDPDSDTTDTDNDIKWDVMISTDASDEERTGQCGIYGRAHSQTVINLDHHITNTLFGDIHLVNADAVSATEIVFDWWQHAGFDINHDAAYALLTGLITDTLGFRVSSVTPRTLQIAQQLMQLGASLTAITAKALDTRKYQAVQLWKRALPSVQLDGDVIHATIRIADAEYAGLDDTSDAGIVGYLIGVEEAMIAAVFKEKPQNKVELSFRCKRGYDVGTLARTLGGGGHTQASGATIDGTVEDVKGRVLPMLQAAAVQGTLDIV